MFYSAQNLTNFSGLGNWDVSKVTNMSNMFYDTSNKANFSALANWNTSNVTNMSNMFLWTAHSQLNLNRDFSFLSNWDTSNVVDMSWMFRLASFLNLNYIKNWNVSKVKRACGMFEACYGLKDLNNLPNFNLKYMDPDGIEGMFSSCRFGNNFGSLPS